MDGLPPRPSGPKPKPWKNSTKVEARQIQNQSLGFSFSALVMGFWFIGWLAYEKIVKGRSHPLP